MPDGSLTRATGRAAGNDIFRGHRLPKDLIGDYFYGEVVARIVRRLRSGEDRRAHAAQQRLSVLRVHPLDRSAVPAGRHDHRARRHDVTSPTCIAASSRRRSGRARGTYLRQAIEQYGSTRSSSTDASGG